MRRIDSAMLARNRAMKIEYDNGSSLRELAAKHGVSFQRVHQTLCGPEFHTKMRKKSDGMNMPPKARLRRARLHLTS
jgi:Mor family transcriptional regulator